jgi:hypothetical protein
MVTCCPWDIFILESRIFFFLFLVSLLGVQPKALWMLYHWTTSPILGNHYGTQCGLELMILLPQLPEYWNLYALATMLRAQKLESWNRFMVKIPGSFDCVDFLSFWFEVISCDTSLGCKEFGNHIFMARMCKPQYRYGGLFGSQGGVKWGVSFISLGLLRK